MTCQAAAPKISQQRVTALGAGRGLEQQVALPHDSCLQPYYGDVLQLLRVGQGPPLST